MSKILIVDDDKLIRFLLRRILQTDYEVMEAETGTEASGAGYIWFIKDTVIGD